MNNIFETVLFMSLGGSVLAIFLFLLRPLMGRWASKAFCYYIWIPVLLRLVIPFGFSVPLAYETPALPEFSEASSDMTEPGTSVPIPSYAVPILPGETRDGFTVAEPQPSARSAAGPLPAEGTTGHRPGGPFSLNNFIESYIGYVWLGGAVVSFGWYLLSYLTYYRRISRSFRSPSTLDSDIFHSLRRTGNVRLVTSDQTETPMHMGILRPVIVLPEREYVNCGMEGELRNVLRHELTHWRRHDLVYKWFAVIVQSIHWFDPIVYIVRRDMERYCELSCDEAVIRVLSAEDRIGYGNTLIALAAEHSLPGHLTTTTLSEGKKQMKERIIGIRDYKKVTASGAAVMLVLALLLTACATAMPMIKGDEESPPTDGRVVSAQLAEVMPEEPEETPPEPSAPPSAPAPRYGNTSLNLLNGGIAAEEGTDLFYARQYPRYEDEAGELIRLDAEGNPLEVLVSGYLPTSLNVLDGWIYYVSYDENYYHRRVYKIRTDGTELTELSPENSPLDIQRIIVMDDNIFCLVRDSTFTSRSVYVLSTEGGEPEPVADLGSLPGSVTIRDGWIYYADSEGLWRIATDKTGKALVSDVRGAYFADVNGRFYFLAPELSAMEEDGTGAVKLLEGGSPAALNISDGWAYYYNWDEWALYKVRLDGTENTKLCVFPSEELQATKTIPGLSIPSISILGDWVYLNSSGLPIYRVHTDGSDLQEAPVPATKKTT